MKKHILALVLTVVCISLYAVNPIKEGNMISGHVIVKGTEENIPYATILISKALTSATEDLHCCWIYLQMNRILR